jgi:hypothetical protein
MVSNDNVLLHLELHHNVRDLDHLVAIRKSSINNTSATVKRREKNEILLLQMIFMINFL